MTDGPKFPEIEVQLSGEDGNAYVIIGRVCSALRRGGASRESIEDYRQACQNASSYDALLQITMQTVEVL